MRLPEPEYGRRRLLPPGQGGGAVGRLPVWRRRRSRRAATPPRTGFTLLELVLVLALLVVLAALAVPLLEKPLAGERLRKAADQVRTEWTRARIRAMSSGVPQVFSFQPETGWYSVEPYGDLETQTEAADATAFGVPAAAAFTGSGQVVTNQRELPEGVVFLAGRTLTDLRSAVGQAQPQAPWSPPVFFYPDGTATTAEVVLRNEHQVHIRVELRGLTGVTATSDLLSADEVAL